jgi:predicted naringenin-chalcone synthase
MSVHIQSLATANPPRYATQEEAFRGYSRVFKLEPAEQRLYRRILLSGEVQGRYVAIERDEEVCETHPDRLLERFLHYGRRIAAEAARKAMADAGLAPSDIGGLVLNTCTGYLCPGLSSYVAEELGLPTDIRVLDLMGMGCGAAIPNLECAAGLAARPEGRPILSVAVEICSATFFRGMETGLIVSNCIFGDGAAAAVIANGNGGHGLARLVDFESGLFPAHRDTLRYRTEGGRLRNTLARNVPEIGAKAAAEVAGRLLARQGLGQGDIAWWIVHPGGTAVLDAVAATLVLPPNALRFSREVFRQFGNMSSPSVLFVLRRILDRGRPAAGQKGIILSFGAGFTAFAALLEF